jgi:hypothetical protein
MSSVPLLLTTLAHEKDLEAKLAASSKAAKYAQTRITSVEAKCKKDVVAAEVKASKAEKSLSKCKNEDFCYALTLVKHHVHLIV